MKYKISQYAKNHNVTYRTVWNWVKEKKVNFEQDQHGTIRIIENIETTLNVGIYARVSSSENKDNLERQKQRLLDYCAAKGYKVSSIVTEIGSGLNDTRPKLERLLLDASITLIVVEHKDRLARFGLNYIEKLLSMQHRKIEIINPQTNEIDDLMQDFVSIITSFTARLYGKRPSKRGTEKLIKSLEND
jgi:predicted site-specific integrase-resolvase